MVPKAWFFTFLYRKSGYRGEVHEATFTVIEYIVITWTSFSRLLISNLKQRLFHFVATNYCKLFIDRI